MGSGRDYHIGAGPREGACLGVAPMFGNQRCVLVLVGEGRGTRHIPRCSNGGGAKTSGRVSDPSVVTWRTVSTPTMAARHWEDA